MIVGGHVIEYCRLIYRKEDGNLLSFTNSFYTIDCEDGLDDIDGNYVMIDTQRSTFISSGAAYIIILRRWKEHTSASMVTEHMDITNKFYSSYLNESEWKTNIYQNVVMLKESSNHPVWQLNTWI